MTNITIRQLQVFVDAAETLSFVRVAEKLRLTPSAVSFQIRQVELQTGFTLFERIGRRVALTEAGAVLLGYARPVLQSMSDLDLSMRALQGVGGGRVRLGLVSTAKYIVPHMIARFRTHYPGVTVSLQEGNRSQILALLLSGGIDLAVMGATDEAPEVVAQRFATHPTVVIAQPTHALQGLHTVLPRALEPEWFVVREVGSGTRALSDRFFAETGFVPKVAMESSSNEMIKQSVIAGMGLAVISQHTVSLELSIGLLTTLPVAGFPIIRSWYVVQRKTAPLLPVQAGVRAYLVENGQAIIDELGRGLAAGPKAAPSPVSSTPSPAGGRGPG